MEPDIVGSVAEALGIRSRHTYNTCVWQYTQVLGQFMKREFPTLYTYWKVLG